MKCFVWIWNYSLYNFSLLKIMIQGLCIEFNSCLLLLHIARQFWIVPNTLCPFVISFLKKINARGETLYKWPTEWCVSKWWHKVDTSSTIFFLSLYKIEFQGKKFEMRDLRAQFTRTILLFFLINDVHNSRVKEFVDVTSSVFAWLPTVINWLDVNVSKKPIAVNVYQIS